jgi:probable F420-dependent oxidoreductase
VVTRERAPHLGVVLPQAEIDTTDPLVVRDFAVRMEQAGFDHLLAFEHVLGADSTQRPGWDGHYNHESPFLEPFALFSYLAAATSMELVTDVLVLPQRQTALVAKQAATADILLGGKLRLGVAIGWNDVEYDALGVCFRTRARRMEEQIPLLRRLWTERSVTHKGEFDTVDRAGIAPLPVQRPIPLWIGCGDAPSALERVGRLADGWIPHPALGDGDRVGSAWATVRAAAERAGRDSGRLGLQGQVRRREQLTDAGVRSLLRWQEHGATHVSLNTLENGLAWPHGHVEAALWCLDEWRSALGTDHAEVPDVTTDPRG